mmetsp:Transcript_72595/g.170210  ORF Transcript_72595/g.170210 Transcript_72595/m.170210 type:complete len:250 (-) Transcript_72595:36-785(-)
MRQVCMYRNTFLNVHEETEKDTFSGRQRSQSADLSPTLAQEASSPAKPRVLEGLLARAAEAFCWDTEDSASECTVPRDVETPRRSVEPVTIPGSYGHPEVCSRPCIHFAHGSCPNGYSCGFCHMEHVRPRKKFDKKQREAYSRLSEAQVLALALAYLRDRAEVEGIQIELMPLFQHIERRLAGQTVQRLPWKKASPQALERTMRRMNTARLFEFLVGSDKVDAHFAATAWEIFNHARAAIHARGRVKFS